MESTQSKISEILEQKYFCGLFCNIQFVNLYNSPALSVLSHAEDVLGTSTVPSAQANNVRSMMACRSDGRRNDEMMLIPSN